MEQSIQDQYEFHTNLMKDLDKKIEDGGIIVYEIQVNYNSGIQQKFWVYEFDYQNGTYTWKPILDTHKPLIIGVNEIESVWQIGLDVIKE